MTTRVFRRSVAAVAAITLTVCMRVAVGRAMAHNDEGRTPVQFSMGPLGIGGISMSFPGGNWHLRDVLLSGPVTGDVAGSANMTVNANLDGILGSGPAWGTVTITTASGDLWHGTFAGRFESGAPDGIQLFSRIVLHGPDEQTLRAQCDETSVTSETLACTGEISRARD